MLSRHGVLAMFLLFSSILVYASLAFSASFILHKSASENAILNQCSFPLSESLLHLDELEKLCEDYRLTKPIDDYLLQVNSLTRLIFGDNLELMFGHRTELEAQAFFEKMVDLQWKHFKTALPDSMATGLQKRAFDEKKYSLIKPIFLKYHELDDNSDEWAKKITPQYASTESAWHAEPMKETYVNAVNGFFKDWVDRPEVHKSYMNELFSCPDDFADAIAFATKQAQIQLDIMKRNLLIVEESKGNSIQDLAFRFRMAIRFQSSIGNYTSVFHDLKKIKSLNGAKRAEAVTNLIVAVSWTLDDYSIILPKEIHHHLKKYVPFSVDWMYAKFRLMEYAAAGSYFPFTSSFERHKSFLETQDSITFLVMSKLILALKPFSSKFCKDNFPYIVFDRAEDEQYMADAMVSPCMKESLSFYQNYHQTRRSINQKSITKFFKELLPEAYANCQKKFRVTCYAPLPEVEMKKLLAGSRKKVKRTVSSPASSEAIVEFTTAKNTSPAKEEVKVVSPSNSDKASSDRIQNEAENLPVEELSKDAPNGPLVEATPKKKISFDDLFKKHVVDVHIEEDLNNEWEEEHQRELAKYAQLKSLPESTSDDVAVSNKRFKLIDCPVTKSKASFVANWSTNDFLDLFPKASEVYYDNVARNTAVRSLSDKTMKFRWIFDPSIVIDVKTFKFLCKVFGLLTGKSELSFLNFQRAFMALTNGSTDNSKKNRTVFKFNHQFELDGLICVPPIGGVHPEHLSSRFNHIQVRNFLEHGAAHPYFFEEIWIE